MKKQLLFIAIMLLSIIAGAQVIIGTGQVVSWNPSNPPPSGVEDGILIEAGATLYITNCTLIISGNIQYQKYIELSTNSRLYLEYCHIEKSTNGSLWGGIRFIHPNNLQWPDVPGYVKISNSEISGAVNVFHSTPAFGGGVEVFTTVFRNNMSIMTSNNHIYSVGRNSCRFTNCDFYNEGCLGTTHTSFFKFQNVDNVRFVGCTFRNLCSNIENAIFATNTSITIEQSTYYGNPHRRCMFSGFPGNPSKDDFAIKITQNPSNQMKKVKITNCDFQASYFIHQYETNPNAILLQGCANPEVYSNTIELRSDGTKDKYGIYLNECTGFVVEDNEITATAQIGNPIFTYGIVVENSGDQTNMLYRNRLYNAEFGIQARGKNRGMGLHYDPEQGLKFFCNEFNSFNTAYYMSAVDCNNPDPLYGVSKWQQGAIAGQPGSPNFNSLIQRQLSPSTTYDFHNDHFTPGTWDIQYMLPSGTMGNYAINYISSSINLNYDPSTTAQDPHCESRLPCVGPLCPALAFPLTKDGYFQNHSTLRMQLSGLVNNGDHSSLIDLVENVDARTLATVYDALMSSVPSHDILTIACANELFSASMIRNILVENSYGIKSLSVREALAQRDNLLSPEMMGEIQTASLQLSEYEELMCRIDYMNQDYMYVMNRSIDALIGRDSIPVDSVKMYLDSIGDMISFIRLIHIAFEENDILGAGDYYVAFELVADDMAELEYYSVLYEDVLLDIYANHLGDFSQMDATQIDLLYNLIETNTYAAAIGKYLLTVYDDYEWIPEHCEISQNSQRKGIVQEKAASNQPQLLLYPNPATSLLNVVISEMEVTTADVEILDISSKLITKERIVSEIGQIDVSLLKPGFYILRVNVKGTVLSKPLIISK